MVFADKVMTFYEKLILELPESTGVEVMNPLHDDTVKKIIENFYKKFYDDSNKHILILGINPGRFGAGVTGIPFTDPVHLEENCAIPNGFNKKKEPSSIFIYDMIDAFGGVESFYAKFFIGAVSPLGFVKDGKNYNYYDSKELLNVLNDYLVKSIRDQIAIGCRTDVCICLGHGKNYKFLDKLNKEYHFFNKIIPLPHPRYIVQYRRKYYQKHIDEYCEVLKEVLKFYC